MDQQLLDAADLASLPTFAQQLLKEVEKDPNAIPQSLLDLPVPTTIKELVTFQQHLTTLILSTHQDQLQSGDFQTRYHLARAIFNIISSCKDTASILNLPDLLPISNDSQSSPFHLCDPTCGTGTFLLSYLIWLVDQDVDLSQKSFRLVGIEKNADSLLVSWLCLTLLRNILLQTYPSLSLSFHLYNDDLLDILDHPPKDFPVGKIDLIVGNPPWVTFSALSDNDRDRWKQLDRNTDFNFIQVKGMQAAMGSGNIDIGIPMMLRAFYQLCRSGANFLFLFKPSLINSPSLYWLRKGIIPHQTPRMISLSTLLSFPANNHFIGRDDLATDCYIGSIGQIFTSSKLSHFAPQNISQVNLEYRSPDQHPSVVSTELLHRKQLDDDFVYLQQDRLPLSTTSSPEIRHGLKHDCKEVYEVDSAKAEQLQWQHIYPTIKSRHMQKNGWTGQYDLVIVPHNNINSIDEELFKKEAPLTYQYLLDHRDRLERRKSRWIKNDVFYAVFGIGTYSFATYKVCWVRLGWKPYFDVISPVTLPNGDVKPVLPSDHYMFIPTENLDYAIHLRDLLNSPPYQLAISQLSSKKKSSLPKKLISRLDLPTEAEYTKI